MRFTTLLATLALCYSVEVSSAAANPMTIQAPNCSADLYLTLPQEFILPKSSSNLLTTLHANENRKSRFSYAFVSDRLHIGNLGIPATILIGTTGQIISRQGQLNESDFVKLRQHTMENDVINDPRTSEYIERLKNGMAVPDDTKITVGKPILIDQVEGPNSFSMLTLVSGVINGETYMHYSIGQFHYKSSCIIFTQIWLPSTLSISAVQDIISRFDLK